MLQRLYGPCKHKAAVEKKYKVWNFDVLPHENEKMRSFYYYLGTGVQREASWFRPLTEEVPFPEPDWNNHENLDVNENISNQENMDTHIHTVCGEKNIGGNEIEEDLLPSFKKTVFMMIHKIEIRYNEDSQGYKKIYEKFYEKCTKSYIWK